jgi:hypothetical protein
MDWLALAIHTLCVLAATGFVLARRRGRIGPRWRAAETVVAIGCAAAMLSLTSGPWLIDFVKAYHYAGQAIVTDPAALYACTRAQCYVNLPIVAWLFVPFGYLEPYASGVLFSLLAAVALAAAVRRLTQHANGDIILWLFVLSGPLYYSVRIGNTTHVILLALVVAFDRLSSGRDRLAGVLLGAAALIKPPLAILLFYLLLRGRVRAAVTMAGVAAATVAASVAVYGADLHLFWFREFVVGHGAAPVAAYNVQSINGFLAHLMTRGHLRDWYPIAAGPAFRAASLLLTVLTLAGVAAVCWRAGRPRTPAAWYAELTMVMTAAVLIAPISWTHYYLWLLIPIAAMLDGVRLPGGPQRRVVAGIALTALLISVPVVILPFSGRITSALYSRVAISHYFYGGVILLVVLAVVRLTLAATVAPPPKSVASTG